MRHSIFAALVVAWFLTVVNTADARPKKLCRGISPAMAAGVAGGKYGVEVSVAEEELGFPSSLRHPHADSDSEHYASIASLMWPKLQGDLVVALTHFPAGMASNPILAEGGVCWAVRRTPHEPDRLAVTWAILEPKTFQLLLVAPAGAIGQKVYITSHDGWKFFNLQGETGPDGQFELKPDDKHIRLVKAGTSEHRRLLEQIRRILTASYNAVEPIVKSLDVDPDKQPGVHGFLRVLFDLIHIVSSLSIIDGNLDPSGRSWDWGRGVRAVSEGAFRVEDFAWRTKVPSAEGTRGDKGASRWDVLGIHQLTDKVEKTYGELEKDGARLDTSWCLDRLLGSSESSALAPTPSSSHEPTRLAEASAKRVERLPSAEKEEVELGKVTIGGREFYTFPKTYNLADALEALRSEIGNWSLQEVQGLNQDLKHNLEGLYLIPAWRAPKK